jgi:hypothetical protein
MNLHQEIPLTSSRGGESCLFEQGCTKTSASLFVFILIHLCFLFVVGSLDGCRVSDSLSIVRCGLRFVDWILLPLYLTFDIC